MRVFPGLVASAMMLAAPACAERAHDSRHRATLLHRRSIYGLHSARPDRHAHARRARDRVVSAADGSASDPEPVADAANDDTSANDATRDEQALESGFASWYGGWHEGHITSSGRPFNQNELTAAHPWLPLGSRVHVTLIGSERSVDVTITDRPGNTRRIIDLSREAARRLGMLHRGTARVTLSQY